MAEGINLAPFVLKFALNVGPVKWEAKSLVLGLAQALAASTRKSAVINHLLLLLQHGTALQWQKEAACQWCLMDERRSHFACGKASFGSQMRIRQSSQAAVIKGLRKNSCAMESWCVTGKNRIVSIPPNETLNKLWLSVFYHYFSLHIVVITNWKWHCLSMCATWANLRELCATVEFHFWSRLELLNSPHIKLG